MKIGFESFMKFRDELMVYENSPKTNDEFVYALEICSLRIEISLPKELFETLKKVDIRHFVAKLDDILEEVSKSSNVPMNEIRSDKEAMRDLIALPYSLSGMAMALDMENNIYSNPILYDLFVYNFLEINKDDEVCEIASLNGYLPALIGMNCSKVTMLNLTANIHGLPENNLKLAGYSLGNITIINDSCPYRRTLHDKTLQGKFSKIYSNIPLTPSQYSSAKKLLKPNGVMFVPAVFRKSEIDMMYYNGEDNVILTLEQLLPTLEEEIKFN